MFPINIPIPKSKTSNFSINSNNIVKMLAVVTGIPGTGKTTVAMRALEMLEDRGIRYELITYGTVMFEIANGLGLVSNRDQMRKLNPEKQREIQTSAAKKISEIAKSRNILLDTHCTINTPKGFLPGLPEWVLRELKPDLIILIEAKTEEIAMRRSGDKTRIRDKEMSDEIALHQEINRDIAAAYSMLSGATIKIIQNPQGEIEKASSTMADVLKQ